MSEGASIKGYFPIAEVNGAIGYDDFVNLYYQPEKPVIFRGIARDWPAVSKWSEEYLLEALAQEPSAKQTSFWYWLDKGGLPNDFHTPEFIGQLYGTADIFSRETHTHRIWVHKKGHVTPFHYDHNMVNVFNLQVTGRKDWVLLSPENMPTNYPFMNFAVIGPSDEKYCRNRIHTKFTLNAGDMLYMPPLWSHKVYARDEENISLNWLMTKRKTDVYTPGLAREQERYLIERYFANHRLTLVRKAYKIFHDKLSDPLRYKWRYEDLMQSPYRSSRLKLIFRAIKEQYAYLLMIRYFNSLYGKNVSGERIARINPYE